MPDNENENTEVNFFDFVSVTQQEFAKREFAFKTAKNLVLELAESYPPETYSDVVETASFGASPKRETTTALDQVILHTIHLAEWLLD